MHWWCTMPVKHWDDSLYLGRDSNPGLTDWRRVWEIGTPKGKESVVLVIFTPSSPCDISWLHCPLFVKILMRGTVVSWFLLSECEKRTQHWCSFLQMNFHSDIVSCLWLFLTRASQNLLNFCRSAEPLMTKQSLEKELLTGEFWKWIFSSNILVVLVTTIFLAHVWGFVHERCRECLGIVSVGKSGIGSRRWFVIHQGKFWNFPNTNARDYSFIINNKKRLAKIKTTAAGTVSNF